jgi:WD40 repeat protein
MATFQDAFISYSRAESKTFVVSLKEQLRAAGFLQVWLDQDDIPSATAWQQRIDDAIERSHNFIYVISPGAIASPYCRIELALAIKYGKRIIPLMHVRVPDYTEWQQQDPEGCATIRQLNWIFFHEGQDDAEQSFQKLCRLLRYCDEKTGQEQPQIKDFVHQHTALLAQALTWDRHHRQNRYLLVGTERQTAETWLQTRFEDSEPLPCTPTDLQCEFITESTKNANNLMTQVFLCHSEEDRDAAEQIRRSLLHRGITVWNYRTDIQTSQDYNTAISRGIEEADNILFLLSPHSAQSAYCQHELQQALDWHKRVIVVLAASTSPELVPESLQSLQYIDLTDNTQEADYLADESQLLKLLSTDAVYHTEHKTWLVQALKWQRQQQNPTLLLRGYNLRRAENWLKVAHSHPHPPTALHDQFIAESLRQPPDPSLDVFISYSRVDSDFARRLNDALQMQNKRTWFDQESIATGTDFQQEIYRGIESSDVFLFVLSPQSVNSPFCADEVEYAHSLNKRMVTVLHRPIDTADLHPVLAKLQWLDFREHDGDFQANFQDLLRTLDTDREHMETHTRLLLRAGEWDRKGRDESLLLRGQDLAAAENWLEAYGEVEPKPTGLQQEYIRAGRAKQEAQAAAEKKLRRGALIGAMAAVAGILVGVGSFWFAWTKQRTANASIRAADERIAEADVRVAEANTKVQEANQQAEDANQQTEEAKQDQLKAQTAAEQAAQAQQTAEARAREADGKAQSAAVAQQQAETKAQAAEVAAQNADAKAQNAEVRAREADNKTAAAEKAQQLAQTGTRLEQAGIAALNRLEFDAVGALLNALKAGKELNEIAANEGFKAISDYPAASPMLALQQVKSQVANDRLFAHKGPVNSAAFSPDGLRVVTSSEDGTVRVWQAESGVPIAVLETSPGNSFGNPVVSQDGQRAVTMEEGIARVLQVETGNHIADLGDPESLILSATFSPDGRRVITVPYDGPAQVWQVETGKLIAVLKGHGNIVRSAAFSPDGQRVVTTSDDGTARVWQVKTGKLIAVLEGHMDPVTSAVFSLDGQQVVTTSDDRTARVWQAETGAEIAVVEGLFANAAFSPDGQLVVVTPLIGLTAEVWQAETGELVAVLEGHRNIVRSAAFSPDGQRVVTTSDDRTARVWEAKTGELIAVLGHRDVVTSAGFSPDGQRVVTASGDGTARVWQVETDDPMSVLEHYDSSADAAFSGDGQRVITVSEDRRAQVWQAETGDLIATFEDLDSGIYSFRAVLSPDGQRVITVSDYMARVWQVDTEEQLAALEGAFKSAEFSPDGQRVITVSDYLAQVWQVDTEAELAAFDHEAFITSAELSPDGQRIVITSEDGTAQVWQIENRKLIASLEGHGSTIYSAKFSPNGQRIVTASEDGTARVWQVETGNPIAVLEGHDDSVYNASFSSDGQQVFTISEDGTVRVWDLKGRQLAIYNNSSNVFNPNYDIETLPELIAWGCQWLHNYLEYGQATNADRALCGLPSRPEEADDSAQFQSSLGQAAGLVAVRWPE